MPRCVCSEGGVLAVHVIGPAAAVAEAARLLSEHLSPVHVLRMPQASVIFGQSPRAGDDSSSVDSRALYTEVISTPAWKVCYIYLRPAEDFKRNMCTNQAAPCQLGVRCSLRFEAAVPKAALPLIRLLVEFLRQALCQGVMAHYGGELVAAEHLKMHYGFGWLTERELAQYVAERGG